MPSKKQKIQNALEAKGYTVIQCDFESIKYYGSGREGGWDIMVDDDIDDFPEEGWEALNKFCIANNIIADCGNGYIMCYTFEDAMKIIDQTPIFNQL